MTVRHEIAASALTDLLFDRTDAGRCLVAPDGSVLRVNDEWLRSTGFSLDEVLGANVVDLFPETRDMALAMHARARAGHTVQVPRHAQRLAGRETWWEGSIAPVEMDGGTGLLITAREVGTVADVTQRKRADDDLREAVARYERQVRLFDGVASTTPDFVYLFDLQGRFLYANRRLLEVWGMQLPDVIGKTCRELGYEQWHHDMHMREIAQVIETRRAIKGEVPFKAPRTGLYGVYEYIFTPVVGPDGAVEIIAGTTRDVTERRHAEDALREAARRKDEFLAMLSHELRNPLAPLRNSAHVLRHAEPGSEPARRAQAMIERQTEHLTRLVDDLLDVTRIAHGKIELRRARADLREVVRRAAEDFRSTLEQRGVEFRTLVPDSRIWAEIDATRITQVVGNLLHNAAKFTRGGDEVTLTVAVRGGAADIHVRDTGTGIEAALLPTVFEPFVQAERTLARTEGGLGLGLALVKGIVELHGGSVEARSEGRGRGAEFLVRLPLLEDAAPAPGLVARPGSSGGRLILLIEDNVDAGQSLADVLELHGHRVRLARDGRAGLDLARELRPDVVLCDVGLPDLDGYEVARALRRDGALRDTRLVALSGYAQDEDRRRAREAGFDAHVAKPADVDELMGVLSDGDG